MATTYTTLIGAADLLQHIDDANYVVIDCRHDLMNPGAGREAYAAGHIPHAGFVDLETGLSGAKRGADGVFRGRHPLPARADLIETLRALGIDDDTQVVAYDAHGGMFAARLWWLLRWIGHAQVAVLDGGLPAWQAQGGATTTDVAQRARGTITERAALVGTVTVEQVQHNLASAQQQVIDARAPDRFRGENETLDPVGGHIPGAKNRFFKDNLQADGRFKTGTDLRADWDALIDDPARVIMQCGSGVTACHNLLALDVAGLSGAVLYPGSWSEWCADSTRPVAAGAA